jgi:hypothetical protein
MISLTGILVVILVLAIIGLIVYIVNRFIPMAEPFKLVINAVVAILILLWLIGFITGNVHIEPLFSR